MIEKCSKLLRTLLGNKYSALLITIALLLSLINYFNYVRTLEEETSPMRREKIDILDLRMSGWNLKEADNFFYYLGDYALPIYRKMLIFGTDLLPSLFITLLTSSLLSMIFDKDSLLPSINSVALITFILDIFENICIILLLDLELDSTSRETIGKLGGVFTVLKWGLELALCTIIIIGFVQKLILKRQLSKEKKTK